jgi:hypothetical protein
MGERAFVIQQIGAKDSSERRRADEIYEYIVVPPVQDAGLEPYRADLDLTPGAITPKMLAELLGARVVIADLTGRNPNVFYELGITHSFARPLISIADSSRSLPFDAKDERVIELGEYSSSGLSLIQGQNALASLRESLRIVLDDNYVPPSPLREVAANRSVDQLAPNDPVAAEMAQMRETLEEIRRRVMRRTPAIPTSVVRDIDALRAVIRRNLTYLDQEDFDMLSTDETSRGQDAWTEELRRQSSSGDDSEYSDEPPF